MDKRHIVLGVLIILIVGAIFYFESMKARPSGAANLGEANELDGVENNLPSKESFKDGRYPLAPELAGISGYLNTDGEEIKISNE